MKGAINMSDKEIDRLGVLIQVQAKRLSQLEASKLLKVSVRQIRKLLAKFRLEGAVGIVSKRRGVPSNNQIALVDKERVIALLKEMYEDFGPSLASEKLLERHNIKVSKETVRKWMIENRLWMSRQSHKVIHKTRLRRSCFGELIQVDGSHHHWFGEDDPLVNLTVFIDDATSIITGAHFSKTETLEAYFTALKQQIRAHGIPRALYSDKASIFHCSGSNKDTQLGRALKTLDIELILANSPQAKGRVERCNRTLQDRLIKEMRLRGIRTIEEANAYLPEFLKGHNARFAREPMSGYNAHRPADGHDLETILCRHETRTLNSSAGFQFNNIAYQLQDVLEIRRLNGQKVEICVSTAGRLRVFLGNREVKAMPVTEVVEAVKELSRKEVLSWEPRKAYQRPTTHPWKKGFYGVRVEYRSH